MKPFIKEKIFAPVPEYVPVTAMGVSSRVRSQNPPVAKNALKINTDSFLANWSVDPDVVVEKYYLDVSTDYFKTYLNGYKNRIVVGTSETVNNLTAYTTYQYRVRALFGSSDQRMSEYSNIITVTTAFTSPIATNATGVSDSSFIANWLSLEGVTSYYVEVSIDPSFNTHLMGYKNKTVQGLNLMIPNLISDQVYYYRVRGFNKNNGSVSGYSNVIKTRTSLKPPVLQTSTNITDSGFRINWNSVPNAVDYYLDVSSDPYFSSYVGSYQNYATGNVNYIDIGGLVHNTTYYFRLRAINELFNSSFYSTALDTTTTIQPPVATSGSARTNTGFTANWNNLTGSTLYKFDLSLDNFSTYVSGYNNLTVYSNNVTVSGLSSNTEYKYRVRAVGSNGLPSNNSNIVAVYTLLDAPVATNETNKTHDTFRANWNTVANATGYYVDVATDINFLSMVSGYNNQFTTNNYLDVTGLQELTNYYYRVRAYNLNSTSNNSNTINVFTSINSPVAQSETNLSSTSFTANWSSVPSATGYYLDLSTDNFVTYLSGYQNYFLTTNFLNVIGLSTNTSYQYRVRSTQGTETSVNSNTVSVLTLLNAPIASSATSITNNSFVANWSTVTGAIEYRLDVSLNNFSTFVSGYHDLQVLSNSQLVSGLAGTTEYKYRVRSINTQSQPSNNSNVITVNTLSGSPTITNSYGVLETEFSITWTSIVGVVEYRLDVSTDIGFTSFVVGYNNLQVLNNYVTVTGLSSLETYYCRVRAVFPLYTSGNSNTYAVTTMTSIFQYLFDEGTGSVLNDASVSNNDGYVLPTNPDDIYTILNYVFTENSGTLLNDIGVNNNDGTVSPTSPVVNDTILRYIFGEGSGMSLNDSGSNNNDGTIN